VSYPKKKTGFEKGIIRTSFSSPAPNNEEERIQGEKILGVFEGKDFWGMRHPLRRKETGEKNNVKVKKKRKKSSDSIQRGKALKKPMKNP